MKNFPSKGLIAPVELRKSEISAKELSACCDIEGQRVEFTKQSVDPQIAVAQGDLDQARAQAALKHSQLDALQVRAGMAGVLQLRCPWKSASACPPGPTSPAWLIPPGSRRRSKSLRPRRAMFP